MDYLKIEEESKSVLSQIHAMQKLFFQEHGRYWQGLLSHKEIPVNGAAVDADGEEKPTNETLGWKEFGIEVGKTPCALRVNVYHAPEGQYFSVEKIVSDGVREITRLEKFIGDKKEIVNWAEKQR